MHVVHRIGELVMLALPDQAPDAVGQVLGPDPRLTIARAGQPAQLVVLFLQLAELLSLLAVPFFEASLTASLVLQPLL